MCVCVYILKGKYKSFHMYVCLCVNSQTFLYKCIVLCSTQLSFVSGAKLGLQHVEVTLCCVGGIRIYAFRHYTKHTYKHLYFGAVKHTKSIYSVFLNKYMCTNTPTYICLYVCSYICLYNNAMCS